MAVSPPFLRTLVLLAVERHEHGGSGWRTALEYAAVRALVGVVGALPRRVARRVGAGIGWVAWRLVPRLRGVGLRNLRMAFPEKTEAAREQILRGVYRSLGLQLAEFCQMRRYTPDFAKTLFRYDGLEHYVAARDRGRGVLVLTGHHGAWELSSFLHSLVGYPMSMLIRRLDNPRVDAFVNGVRSLHGNRVIHKDDFARGLLKAMGRGETVGVLMDTNMTPPQGVFVPFFGIDACTGAAVARIAARTGAAVLPGFLLWEPGEGRYVLHFGREIDVRRSHDAEADAIENTARFTAELERWIRRYPDQWLWVHRRWKTRPTGEESLYR